MNHLEKGGFLFAYLKEMLYICGKKMCELDWLSIICDIICIIQFFFLSLQRKVKQKKYQYEKV